MPFMKRMARTLLKRAHEHSTHSPHTHSDTSSSAFRLLRPTLRNQAFHSPTEHSSAHTPALAVALVATVLSVDARQTDATDLLPRAAHYWHALTRCLATHIPTFFLFCVGAMA
jgi:hypothetical protein